LGLIAPIIKLQAHSKDADCLATRGGVVRTGRLDLEAVDNHQPCGTPMADDTTAELRLEREGGIAFLVIHNPARLNALTSAMWAALPGLLARAETDASVRVIVLKGSGGKAFSAGADISEFDSARTGNAANAYDALNHAAFEALLDAHKPTIAMIEGFCLGGGLGIAACCDLRIANDAATFAIPAAKLGLGYHPRWVRTLLTLAPPASIKELIFTGRRFTAPEALAMGLVNRVHPAAALDGEARSMAETIAANAPMTIRAAKAAIDELTLKPETADIARLEALVKACFDSSDYAEGRRAFAEKRKPQFKGA
jgi:enoyl-CoA hydratase